MTIKTTLVGALIYAAMLLCLGAFGLWSARRQRAGHGLFALAFVATLAAFFAQWRSAGHVPMQSLFDVFLCLGVAIYPLSLFWRRVLGAEGMGADALIGLVVLAPAGFVFKAEPQPLPPALLSELFIPHVAAYLMAYVVMIKAALLAVRPPKGDDDCAAYRLVRFAFPLLTTGLLLGAWWGKLAWGNYWNWDPKELWALATWLVYLGYLHLRSAHGTRYARLNAAMVVAGAVCIVLTLLWVNLATKIFPGMHSYAF